MLVAEILYLAFEVWTAFCSHLAIHLAYSKNVLTIAYLCKRYRYLYSRRHAIGTFVKSIDNICTGTSTDTFNILQVV